MKKLFAPLLSILVTVTACSGDDLYSDSDADVTSGSSADTSSATTSGAGGDAQSASSASGQSVVSSASAGGAGPSSSSAQGTGGSTPMQVTDFALEGSFTVAKSTAAMQMPGCGLTGQMSYDLYLPNGAPTAPLVVLGHGFQRDKDKMGQMAKHMASYGVRVVAPKYCHSSFGDTDHAQNGADQVVLANALAAGAGVIHAGYSAGGTAALVAATNDPNTIAVLGLDAVDSGGLAAKSAATLNVPGFGLVGESSNCNSNNNGGTYLLGLAPKGWSVRVKGATHCDFEGPSDFLCTGLCGGSSAGAQKLVIQMATAFVAWQAGIDPTGAAWVEKNGSQFDKLTMAGQIAPL